METVSKVPERREKAEEMRRELGAKADGSMGAYGGRRYEGLGSRDVVMGGCRSFRSFGGSRVRVTTRICRRSRRSNGWVDWMCLGINVWMVWRGWIMGVMTLG